MSKFNKLVTTNSGMEIINDSLLTSDYITFTKIISSSDIYNDNDIKELKKLSNVKQSVNVTKTSKMNDNSILVEATINNTDLTEPYFITTIGLCANYNGKEILFAVASVESVDKGTYMPVYNDQVPTGLYLRMVVTIDCADNITFNIDPTGYATLGDIQLLKEEIELFKPKNKVLTLNFNNWEQNQDTFYFEYDVLDENVTSNTKIEIDMDIPNQEKITGLIYTISYNGGFKIITNEEIYEDIDVSISYQKMEVIL